MRKTYVTILLCILAPALFSQDAAILKNFKYRINTYRAINYSINGSSQYNQSEFPSGIRNNSSSSGAFGASYFTTRSTDRILLTASGGMYSSFNSGKSERQAETNTSRGFYMQPRLNVLNKWFSKKMFTELGADISTDLHGTKDVVSNLPGPAKSTQSEYSVAINTGVGKGRLENVTDMQNALWLCKALEEANLLSRKLTVAELTELGQTVTAGNNTRVLDLRKRTQFILKTVDNYFQEKGLISNTGIDYFTHLNDILFFAINNQRLSGSEKYIRFTPAISGGRGDQTQNNIINKYEQRYNTRSLLVTSGITKHVPVNLQKQHNYGAALKLALISKEITDRYLTSGSVTSDTKSNSTLRQAGVNLFFQQVIYPNTRTVVYVDLQAQGGYQDLSNFSNFYGAATLTGVLNYFISYRTRLTCNIGATCQKNIYYYNQYFNLPPNVVQLNANAGLEISL